MRRNTLHQEMPLLRKREEELKYELAKVQQEITNANGEIIQLNKDIHQASFELEMIEEWHWENQAGERIEP